MRILVDADACPIPVKELLYKTIARRSVELILVANSYIRTPPSELIQSIVVAQGDDVADDHIVDIVLSGDLVITADIPLADRVVKKGGVALNPRGTLITDDNVGSLLAVRNLMTDMRSAGMETAGPAAYGQKDKQEFANQLDAFITRAQKHL